MLEKASAKFQRIDDEIQLLLEATQNLKAEEDYKWAYGLNSLLTYPGIQQSTTSLS